MKIIRIRKKFSVKFIKLFFVTLIVSRWELIEVGAWVCQGRVREADGSKGRFR